MSSLIVSITVKSEPCQATQFRAHQLPSWPSPWKVLLRRRRCSLELMDTGSFISHNSPGRQELPLLPPGS